MDKSDSEVAAAWITYCQAAIRDGVESPVAEANWWACEEVERLCDDAPASALRVILEILKLSPDERIRENLAAGPLETLLVKQGEAVIGSVESLIASNREFKELVEGVWRNKISEQVWERLERAVTKPRSQSRAE